MLSGLLNILMLQFNDLSIDIGKILAEFKTDPNVLKNPVIKIDAGIVGRYLEEVVRLNRDHRTGLKVGFLIPFSLTGTYFNLYNGCNTVSELFENLQTFSLTDNNITHYNTRLEGDDLHYEVFIDPEFKEKYSVAVRQWYEMQYGIALQYAYSYTGHFFHPVFAHSVYKREEGTEPLEEYLHCPVKFNQEKLVLGFKKSILDLPVITAKKELFPLFENVMGEIEYKQNANKLSNAVRRYLMHTLSTSVLNLKHVAERFNMSERNIQRKLKTEGTSYQQILDNLRMELAQKYLKERIPLVEITFLLGFESQSAFNKFFNKHFHTTPSRFS